MIYWDTSAAIKLYATETDSAAWQEFNVAATEPFASSALMDSEMAIALFNKEARGEMRSDWARKLHAEFRLNVQSGGFRIVPVGPDILERSIVLAERCIMSRTPVFLRTLDGIHLATAFHLGCSSIATADIRVKKAAKILGLPVAAP